VAIDVKDVALDVPSTPEAGSPQHVRDRARDAEDSETEDTAKMPAADDQVVVPVGIPQILEKHLTEAAGWTEAAERRTTELLAGQGPIDVASPVDTAPARKAETPSKPDNADQPPAANPSVTTPLQEDTHREWLAPVTDSIARRPWVAELMDAKRKPGSSSTERESAGNSSLKAASQASTSAPAAIEPSRIAVSRTADVPQGADIAAKHAASKSVVAFQVPAPQPSTTWDRGVTVINTATVGSAPAETPVADQIVRSIRIQALLGGGEVELQLDPKYLGAVRISLKVVNDAVTAQIHADQPAVREWLDGHQQQLRDAIGEHGLKLGHLDIAKSSESQQNRDRSREDGERREQEPQRRRRRPAQQLPEFDLTA